MESININYNMAYTYGLIIKYGLIYELIGHILGDFYRTNTTGSTGYLGLARKVLLFNKETMIDPLVEVNTKQASMSSIYTHWYKSTGGNHQHYQYVLHLKSETLLAFCQNLKHIYCFYLKDKL